jgi:hypothetical protein
MTKNHEKKTGHDKQGHHLSKKEWEAKIIAHAWKDHEFKKRLLADPKSALKELHVPVEKHVKVIEEHENQWVIVLPSEPAESKKLSEVEFGSLAGGSYTQLPSSDVNAASVCQVCF